MAGPVVWVKYMISLLGCHAYDRTPYVHNTRKGAVQFLADRRSSSRGWKKFIPLEQVTAPASSLLHDGALMIRCTVSVLKNIGLIQVNVQQGRDILINSTINCTSG